MHNQDGMPPLSGVLGGWKRDLDKRICTAGSGVSCLHILVGLESMHVSGAGIRERLGSDYYLILGERRDTIELRHARVLVGAKRHIRIEGQFGVDAYSLACIL